MSQITDALKQKKEAIQKSIQDKLDNGKPLTNEDINNYEWREEDKEVVDEFNNMVAGKPSSLVLKDFLASPQAKILIPRVVVGSMRKAADPIYLASQFFKKIRLKSGAAIMFPSIGVMRAYDVAEGQEIPQETLDWQLHKGGLISTGKSGVRIQFTDDLIKECEFDIVGMMLSEAGRAMARHKEQKAFTEWKSHGWKVFDNELRRRDPVKYAEAGTTGVDFYNNLNDTMSVDDLLDLIIAVYNNEYTPTDLVIHPLAWTAFARNGLTGGLTSARDRDTKTESPNATFRLGPESIQGRIPFGFNINLSPFCPIDKVNKTFDIYCVDRNNVGVEIVKSDLKTDEFNDLSRDINNIKVTEAYGFGLFNKGKAICSAQNISMARTYAAPERAILINK